MKYLILSVITAAIACWFIPTDSEHAPQTDADFVKTMSNICEEVELDSLELFTY